MLKAFIEVIFDLWLFAIGREADGESLPSATSEKNLDTYATPITRWNSATHLYGAAFIISKEEPLLREPTFTIDGQVAVLRYGDEVVVKKLQGNYAEVVYMGEQGWVHKESLNDDSSTVFPCFEPGYVYHSRHEDTIKLRKYSNDEALCGRLGLPIQPIEHVVFITKRKKLLFTWPPSRPRTPGQLNTILRGRPGVYTSIEPRTDAIIESTDPEGRAFIGYVDAVHPDNSIVVSSFGRVTEGEYRRETFTESEWKEWRPVFLTLS